MKKILYVLMILTVFLVLVSCDKKNEEVKRVEDAIEAIGDVITAESIGYIENAKKLYSHLSVENQDKVSNYAALINAENAYKKIREEALIYENISICENIIDEINLSKMDAVTTGQIAQALQVYESIPIDYRNKVLNYSKLVTAQEKMANKKGFGKTAENFGQRVGLKVLDALL